MTLNTELIRLFAALVGLVLGITIHEFSHALAARLLGDRTAERMGRLSLNPIVHLDPLGSLMMLLTVITGFGIGWGKPTPVSPWNLRPGRRAGMALVASAGPFSNFVVAFILSLMLRFLPMPSVTAGVVLFHMLSVNLGLAAFNLLPIPILDGFHILIGIASTIPSRKPSPIVYHLERLEAHGPMLLMVLILLNGFLPFRPLELLLRPLFSLLLKIIGLA